MNEEPPIVRPTQLVYQTLAVSAPGAVTLAGFIRDSAGVAGTMRVFGRYAVVLVLDGRGRYHDVNGIDVPVRIGDLILVLPEVGHWYGPGPGESWSEFYIVFEGAAFDAWRSPSLLDASRPLLHLSPLKYWAGRMEAILEADSDLGKVCRMQQFLADVFEHERQASRPEKDHAWLARAQSLLSALQTDPPLRAEEVAQRLGLSYEVFRKKFAKLTGLPPTKYRDARIMDLASRLLTDRDLPLKSIAARCQFCDEFHFSRRFKQRVGMSPSEFRKRLA